MTFTEAGLPAPLVEALAKENITEPTAIQVAALPELLAGKSAYLNSETGTGKTLAYLLPLLCRIDPARAETQAIVVAPTHELAIQIHRQACSLTQNSGLPIRSVLLIGGTLLQRQIDKLKKKPQLVIGSPGRMRDLLGANRLKAGAVRCVVVDETDRLLGSEELDSVRVIIRACHKDRQLIFASATEQPECTREAEALAPGLLMLRTAANRVNANIEHLYLVCEERDKPVLLRKLIHALNPERALVFVHRNTRAEDVASELAFHKLAVADLHGAFDKSERKKAMDDFRGGRARILIASDLAARGLDIKGVSHVFNLDIPSASDAYLHRVGRTARAGAQGHAVSLMTEQEVRLVQRFETDLGIHMTPVRLREGKVLPAGA